MAEELREVFQEKPQPSGGFKKDLRTYLMDLKGTTARLSRVFSNDIRTN